ncbi:MAG TPA: hypothetical protein VEQ58_22490, partial [Polyangiaceae bacterium]|nr:hypothetical protein [Polyangiaceae bacterium]
MIVPIARLPLLRTSLTLLMLASLSGCSDDKSTADGAGGNAASAAGTNNAEAGKASGSAGKTSGSGGKTSGSGGQATGTAGKSGGSGGTTPIGGGKSTAAEVARKLGRAPNFLIGMGNDLPKDYKWENSGIYTLGAKLDIHYIYLTYTWETWNDNGEFPKIIGTVDMGKGTVPMSSVYDITGKGENNFDVLTDDTYMTQYWATAKLLMQRYAELDTPAVVHLEPDFWAYAQQKSGGDPTSVAVHLSADCPDLPADLSGMARCWFKLARANAPKVLIGLHASEWAAGSGNDVGAFLNKLGAAES